MQNNKTIMIGLELLYFNTYCIYSINNTFVRQCSTKKKVMAKNLTSDFANFSATETKLESSR